MLTIKFVIIVRCQEVHVLAVIARSVIKKKQIASVIFAATVEES